MRALALAVLACALGMAQTPEAWPDPGPPSSRDLFPLNLIPLTYRPISAMPLGRGVGQASFQVMRSNTFEFSDLIKDALAQGGPGRLTVDRAGVAEFARNHPGEPLIYYFDGEIQRAELNLRYGAGAGTDVAVTLAWQGISEGFLDGAIETFHHLGFQQTGRTGIAKDQLTLAVIQKGEVTFFSNQPVRAHPEDPVVTVVQRVHEGPVWTLSLLGSLQLPLTRWGGFYRSDWDSSAGLLFQARPGGGHVFDGGGAYQRRSLKRDGPAPFFIKDQAAMHLGWEWRGWKHVRPYLVLVGTGAITPSGPGSKLDRPSLIHDLGVHVRVGASSALTLSYINNITHNENTADMGLALRLTVRVRPGRAPAP